MELTTNKMCLRCEQPFSDGDETTIVTASIGDLEIGPYLIHLDCERPGDELSELP